jgi:hypothetical protein
LEFPHGSDILGLERSRLLAPLVTSGQSGEGPGSNKLSQFGCEHARL